MSGPIARGGSISLAIRLSGFAVLYIQAVIVARLLGASGYGTTSFAMSIAGIAAMICQMGFGALAVREVAARLASSDTAGVARYMGFSLRRVAALAGIVGIGLGVAGFGGWFVAETYGAVVGLGGFLVLPLALIGLFRGISLGLGNVAMAQVPGDLMRPVVLLIALGAGVGLGVEFGPTTYMLAALASAVLAALLAWIWLRRTATVQPVNLPADPGERRGLTRAALPFLGLGLTAILQGEANTLLLAAMAGPREAGLFQPIVRTMPLMTLAVMAASMRYTPRMAEFWARGETARIQSVTRTFAWTTFLATLAISLVICLLGPWLMWTFGSEFVEVAPLLWLVAAAQVFAAACGPAGALMSVTGRSGVVLAVQLSGLVVNLALGLALIGPYGVQGAVIALVSATVLWSATMALLARRNLSMNTSVTSLVFNRNEP